MLRHYTLLEHESCQSRFFKYFNCLIFLLLLGTYPTLVAQTEPAVEVKVKQIEYIDQDSEQVSYLNSESTKRELKLSRNYNHVYIELEEDPTIQYAYKVTGEAGLGDWKNATNEIHLVGLSRGSHQLCIRGERNGLTSELQQYDIFVTTPF